ncbi:flavoprotein [Psychrobacillus sp. NEAU-3TGS]|uniref:flavoprotein n=1 Tax=Psychrobacillus sp. NEAU-3TGS TaxID=2995412 RepID=UPI0024972AD4|nr:flavoprotein [Psychrobacillus sp. NEAU-3TGS]MDI2589092.1 flavoprotein [Psychrobacillus sp. NEAU-3TGS]
MQNSFSSFLDNYLEIWRNSSLADLKNILSKDYKAREITGEEIVDFGYEESIKGWEQGFKFAKENNAEWKIDVISMLPLREGETMVIISATLVNQGKSLETANLFFQTFQKNSKNEWKLVRSYIEAGIPYVNINNLIFNQCSS